MESRSGEARNLLVASEATAAPRARLDADIVRLEMDASAPTVAPTVSCPRPCPRTGLFSRGRLKRALKLWAKEEEESAGALNWCPRGRYSERAANAAAYLPPTSLPPPF